jgi:hypothetical protein
LVAVIISSALLAAEVALPQHAFAATSASDDFARANGSLGPDWSDISDGGLAISSQTAVGTGAAAVSGDTWAADSFTSDQYSQITLTATQPTGGQWIGTAVRAQDSGQSAYVGIYYANSGNPELMLFLRSQGGWTELGGTYSTGDLPAGTQLELTAVGGTLSFTENGTPRITATNGALTGGAPGIIAFGTTQAASWAGGNATASTATYTVGGTVSGLTGTVVLQDNGTDSLSLTSDGSFTFATPLTDGSAYNVTVASQPGGQNCSVSGGSGTVSGADVTSVAVSCVAVAAGASASDDFARANGSLGPNWSDISDGGLAISSQIATGSSANAVSGDTWAADSFTSDQYSQITLTATPPAGSQWIGAAVRAQNSGQSAYVGIYYANSGNPELMLFLRSHGNWTEVGGTYSTGSLPAGTQLELTAVGNTLSFTENGTSRITVTDNTLTGGAPGIIAFGTTQAASWAGGNAGFQVTDEGNSAGIESYQAISPSNGYGPQTIRVLQPTDPAPGVAHNFLIVLPVETGLGDTFGDGLATMQSADAEDQYNLTVVEPTFTMDPWYANSASDPNLQYETFMTQELVPWIKQNFATTGNEQVWLIGFSKSGVGGQDLILKHPDVFTLAASWDFPADMSSYNEYGNGPALAYGTDANFQANYRLTSAFVQAHATPFEGSNRIWIGGYNLYPTDVSDYDALLTADGVQHTTETPTLMAHSWTSGWVPLALAALYQDSLSLGG